MQSTTSRNVLDAIAKPRARNNFKVHSYFMRIDLIVGKIVNLYVTSYNFLLQQLGLYSASENGPIDGHEA